MIPRWLILLILILVITPVEAAFDHYSVMVKQLSTEQNTGMAGTSCSQHIDPDQSPHPKSHLAGCHFHTCVDVAIAPSYCFPQAYGSPSFGYLQESMPGSFLFSPEIRPPIRSL